MYTVTAQKPIRKMRRKRKLPLKRAPPAHEPQRPEPTPNPSQEGNSGVWLQPALVALREVTTDPFQEGNSGVRLPSTGGAGGGFWGTMRDHKIGRSLPAAGEPSPRDAAIVCGKGSR